MKRIFRIIICLFSLFFLLNSKPYIFSKEDEIEEFNKNFIELIEKTSTDYNFNFLKTLEYGNALQELYLMVDELCMKYIIDYEDPYLFGFEFNNLPDDLVDLYDEKGENEFRRLVYCVLSAYKIDHPIMYFFHDASICSFGFENSRLNNMSLSIDRYALPFYKYDYNKIIYQKTIEYGSYAEGIDSAYTKARIINKIISDNMYYEYNEDGTPSQFCYAHNILGFFLYGKGVCETYAYTFSVLMNYVGVECFYVCGNLDEQTGASHAWNIARMNNNEWYWFDITVNDDDKKGTEQKTYLAFNNDKNSVSNVQNYSEYYYNDSVLMNLYFSYISVPELSKSTDKPEDWYTITYNDVLYEIENDKLYILDNPKQNEIPEKIELKWRTFTTQCIHDKLIDKDNCKMCLKCFQLHTAVLKSRYVEPTCTEDGKTIETTCAYCNQVLEEGKIILKIGHTLSDWIVDVEPTKDVYGYKHIECLTCGERVHSEKIPKLGGCKNKSSALYSCLLIFNCTFVLMLKKRKY